ncbi:TetR/AcrR family transcriptional regulator [Defluviimonas salinarum]|uniref:TetR/AcrR family transcriptional regulator n=1 Tax=Defluviimonas salinarum TaxID=2992147 RepID=A0ABT3J7J8_9RHOB|nr:TetR/AcrR family transcriptional regulator [Defluviimonas salinarum]MCW3783653.1 TetR/AcrR family transcriptional regulator [Defluviimonas salinarum]
MPASRKHAKGVSTETTPAGSPQAEAESARRNVRAAGQTGRGSPEIGLRGSVVRDPEQRETQRQEILIAASRVFARKGYEAATMNDIAAEMGVSKGILYYQFKSKQDLIVATRRRETIGAGQRLQEICDRPGPVLDRLEAEMRNQIEKSFDETTRHMILTPGTIRLEDVHLAKIREPERAYERRLAALIEEGIATGEIAPVDPLALAYTMIRAAQSPATWFRPGGRLDKDEVIAVLIGFIMRGVRAAPTEVQPSATPKGSRPAAKT